MTLTELRKRLPKDALIKVTPPGIMGDWGARALIDIDDYVPPPTDLSYEIGTLTWEAHVEVHVYDHPTRKAALAALAEKLEEIGVLK